ncbi:unnamed protein product [Didymodactylos carnosus]|uniref:G-protein coupled receptors family 1 profile domain-containing protein n=1 Tax=Didymodactylos carnosus TaxID=1234261 RepID=A0A814CZR4_9BILA|nr:unnamed protein product [Didymodactylos carnosus]CAF3723448.1 unnamed protein product [Didymodactylos carnosus]
MVANVLYMRLILIVLISSINVFHLWYLIFKRFQSDRLLTSLKVNLFSSSIASLVISLWLIPSFFTQTTINNLWTPLSYQWRWWLYVFHVIDSVQILSLLLLTIELYFIQKTLSIRLYQSILFVIIVWLAPIIAFSPILWLSEQNSLMIKRLNKQQSSITSQLSDYFPFSLFQRYSTVLTLPYLITYIIPLFFSLSISLLSIVVYIKQKKTNRTKKETLKYKTSQIIFDNNMKFHQSEIVELHSLIQNIFNLNFNDKQPITTSTLQNYPNNHLTTEGKTDGYAGNSHCLETIWSSSKQSINDQEELYNHSTKKIRTSSYEASRRSSIGFDHLVSTALTNNSNNSGVMNRASSIIEEDLSSSSIIDSETLFIPSQTTNQTIKSKSSRIIKNLVFINVLSIIIYLPHVISILLLTYHVIKIQPYFIIYSIYFHWFGALLTPLFHLHLQHSLFTLCCVKRRRRKNNSPSVYLIKNQVIEKQPLSRRKQIYKKFTNEKMKYYKHCKKTSDYSRISELPWMPSTVEYLDLRKVVV